METGAIAEKLSRYFELNVDEQEELYDLADTLYNELISKYLEALASPEENKPLVESVLKMAIELLGKKERGLLEDLALIAILDIICTDLHDRLVGFVEAESEEEE
jgi:hypothetical protein